MAATPSTPASLSTTTSVTRYVEKPYDVYLEGNRLSVVNRISSCKYVKDLDEKFYASLAGHSIFTPDDASAIVEGLIPTAPQCIQMAETCVGGNEPVDEPVSIRHETDTEMVVTLRYKYPLPRSGTFRRDSIHIACPIVEEKDEARTIRALQGEVALLTERLVESERVIRRLEIHRMYNETVATFGPEAIPPPLYEFAMKIFSAELDGRPFIFPIIGPNSINGVKVGPWDGLWTGPYWLRSVVCILPMAFPVWHRLEKIQCRRLIVTNADLNHTGTPTPTTRLNGTAGSVMHTASASRPVPGSILSDFVRSTTLHPDVRSVVFDSYISTTRVGFAGKIEPISTITCRKMNETTRVRAVILPTASKGEIVGAKIMTNARFSDTTERCLDAPLSWEAEDLQDDIATANASVEGLTVPTF